MQQDKKRPIRDVVLATIRATKSIEMVQVSDEDDIFSRCGLNSMETLSVLIKLEQALGVVIGETPSDFDRIRTFSGLLAMLAEKGATIEASTSKRSPAA